MQSTYLGDYKLSGSTSSLMLVVPGGKEVKLNTDALVIAAMD